MPRQSVRVSPLPEKQSVSPETQPLSRSRPVLTRERRAFAQTVSAAARIWSACLCSAVSTPAAKLTNFHLLQTELYGTTVVMFRLQGCWRVFRVISNYPVCYP